MFADTLNPDIFIHAFRMVLASFSATRVVGADIRPAGGPPGDGDVFVSMGIMGDLDARVSMSMNAGTVRSLASDMLPGVPVTELDELALSAVGELCNMMMGTACQSLSQRYENVDITPPTVALGPVGPAGQAEEAASISIRLTETGPVNLVVAMRCA